MTKAVFGDGVVKLSAFLLIFILLVFAGSDLYLYKQCFKAAQNINSFCPFVQIRFIIYGSSDSTTSGSFRIYNNRRKELAVIERSWPESILYIDFVSAAFLEKIIQFPLRIYSSSGLNAFKSRSSGTQLSRFYMEDGNCLLYNFPKSEDSFSVLGRYALGLNIFGKSPYFGGSSHIKIQSLSLGGCEAGKTYVILTDSSGSLFLLPEE